MCKLLPVFFVSFLAAVLLNVSAFSAAAITEGKAKEIALAKTGGGTGTECKISHKNVRKIYGIAIINGSFKRKMDISVTDLQIYDYDVIQYSNYHRTQFLGI